MCEGVILLDYMDYPAPRELWSADSEGVMVLAEHRKAEYVFADGDVVTVGVNNREYRVMITQVLDGEVAEFKHVH